MEISLEKHKKRLSTITYLLNDETHSLSSLDDVTLATEYQKTLYESFELNRMKNKPVLWCLSIEDINHKEYITAKEFEKLTGYGVKWQQQKIGRIHNPLPKVSKYAHKIQYHRESAMEWFRNEILA